MSIKISKTRWQSIQTILDQVLDLPQLEQLNFLKQQCKGDTQLYNDIKSLLEDERAAPDFLDKPALELAETLMQVDLLSLEAQAKTTHSIPDFKNTQIGPYQLCEEIGRGGMGVVYRAERRQGDFEQQVAIKLLWNWKNRDAIIERFQREQQLLAALNHPNIAQLYDGGLTKEGQPYFVMEYIQGEPINHYCDQQQLTIEARLQLLLQVIEPLSFAHKHLIVHRDIKPSNIFVTKDGQIKLLDFGIAKFLNEQDHLELTQTGEQLLTPGFAAPEQLQNKPITVATDVYQLGLVIYELLTGRQAYRDKADSFIELIQVVCEQEPTRPSLIIDQKTDNEETCTPESLSKHRGLSPKQLQKKLHGDLDAITLKTLRNTPNQRYISMELLKTDIHAYFDNRPISAQEQKLAYQGKKFIRRHWRSLSVASTFILLLLTYAITVTQQIEKTNHALKLSVLEKNKAQQVSEFLANIFKAADPNVAGLKTITAQTLLDKGQNRILEELNEAPEVQAHMLTLLGEIYYSQGIYTNSADLLKNALTRQRATNNFNKLDLANTLTQLGITYMSLGQINEAEALFEESLAIHNAQNLQKQPANQLEYAETLSAYGQLLYRQKDSEQAERYIIHAIELLRNAGFNEHEELATALNNLASLQHTLGKFESARQNMQQAIKVHKKVLGETHSYYTVYLSNFAVMLTDMELYQDAEPLLREALSLQESILGSEHPYVARTLRSLGILMHRRGLLDKAVYYLRKNIQLKNNAQQKNSISIAVTYMWLGEVLQDLKKFSEAEHIYEKMMHIFRKKIKHGPTIGRALGQQASLAYAQGNLEQATKLYKQAINEIPADNIRITYSQVGYAQILLEQNHTDEAESLLRSALELRKQAFPAQHGKIAEVNTLLGIALSYKGQLEQAKDILKNSVTKLASDPLFQYGNRKKLLQLGHKVLAQ